MTEIIEFKPKQADDDFLIGPFEVFHVQVEGRVIPRLTGRRSGQEVELIVDGRFSVSFPEELARSAAWLIANALAVGEGYASLGSETRRRPFAPQCTKL